MTPEERIAHIGQALDGLRHGWSFVAGEIDLRVAELTEQLINNDNEQTRGRIKALLELKRLPETLHAERDGMSAALAEQAAAD